MKPERVSEMLIAWTEARQGQLTDDYDPLVAIPESALSAETRTAMQELYDRNYQLHHEGIGNKSNPNSLHSTHDRASKFVGEARQREARDSPSFVLWFGHIAAGVFGIIGVGFLVEFLRVVICSIACATRP